VKVADDALLCIRVICQSFWENTSDHLLNGR
jgi:hypothetical protein